MNQSKDTLNEKRSWSDHTNDEDWDDISGVGFLNGIGKDDFVHSITKNKNSINIIDE